MYCCEWFFVCANLSEGLKANACNISCCVFRHDEFQVCFDAEYVLSARHIGMCVNGFS